MKTIIHFLIALPVLILPTLVTGQNTRFTDSDTVINEHFWGDLHSEGGSSFFCAEPFTSKGFLLTDGYIYPLSQVRSALDCGTRSQCNSNDQYRQISSDLHNIVPVSSRIEMSRRNSRYEDLGSTGGAPDDCGIRQSAQFFEPPGRLKGDIARTVAYMVSTYGLPWAGAHRIFIGWNQIDPPDDQELTRHRLISDIQGNDNRFILNPSLVGAL